MPTATATPHPDLQQFIEQRLDTIDQALLGLLPRQDRLATVAQVETRIHEKVAANAALARNLQRPANGSILSDSSAGRWTPPTKKTAVAAEQSSRACSEYPLWR